MPKQEHTCPIHNIPLTYSRKLKQWFCKDCLYASFLTHQAQQDAVKRYSQTEKGKRARRDYELSKKGTEARARYLKSEKYKQRRREYNQRLKESLQIARQALTERAIKDKAEELLAAEERLPLIQDIREYIDVFASLPAPSKVITWARDAYSITLSSNSATALINKASKRR